MGLTLVPSALGSFVGHGIGYDGTERVELEKALRWYCCFHVVCLSNENYHFNSNFIIGTNYPVDIQSCRTQHHDFCSVLSLFIRGGHKTKLKKNKNKSPKMKTFI